MPWPSDALEGSIPDRFAAMVRTFRDRPAVVGATRTLTYAELDQASASLAAAVSSLPEARPGPVGILLDQGLAVPIAILGALRAGRPYLPIDPAEPAQVLRATLDHVGVPLLLADRSTISLATAAAGDRPVIDVDQSHTAASGGWTDPPIDPDEPATLYDTSGSTGRPKTVVDSHRNVLHNVHRYADTLAIGPEDRLSMIHAPTFSGIVSTLFAALLDGAAVAPFDLRHGGLAALAEFLRAEKVTMLHAVPAVFRALARADARFPAIRVVRLEGDRATWADVERSRRHFPRDAVLVNGLGATETGLTRQFFVAHDTPLGRGDLPIGYPVAGVDVAIVTDDGATDADGSVGEIEVRGRYLALGYWRDPARTAAAFTVDPAEPARRRYRTGDIGRLDPDGRLHHLGRADQVHKVRGRTVDPGVIEARLAADPRIRDAIALTRLDGDGEARLVAYVVPAEGAGTLDPVALRSESARHLPAHLVPTAIVILEALPLTSTGKVDRGALPAPGRERPVMADPYVPPRDPLEETLVATWESTLDIRPIGVHDDFIDLGGDSLAAATMLLEVGAAFQLELGPGVMARVGTVDELAREIRRDRQGDPTGPDAPAVVTTIAAVHAVPGLSTFFHAVARDLPPGIGLHVLHPDRVDGIGPPEPDVEQEAATHVERLRRVQPFGPYHLAGFCYGGLVAFEMARRLRAEGQAVASLTLLGVTPLEFPTLMGPAARSRFRRSEWRRRARLVQAGLRRGELRVTASSVIGRTTALVRRAWYRRRRRATDQPSGRAPDGRAAAESAIARYAARAYDGDITVIVGRDAEPRFLRDASADLGGLARGEVRLVLLPGDDHAMLSRPVATVLAAELARRVTGRAVP